MTLMVLFPDRTDDTPREDFELTGQWWLREDGRLMLGVKRKRCMELDHYEWRYEKRKKRFLWWTWEKQVSREYPVYEWTYTTFWIPEFDFVDIHLCGCPE